MEKENTAVYTFVKKSFVATAPIDLILNNEVLAKCSSYLLKRGILLSNEQYPIKLLANNSLIFGIQNMNDGNVCGVIKLDSGADCSIIRIILLRQCNFDKELYYILVRNFTEKYLFNKYNFFHEKVEYLFKI